MIATPLRGGAMERLDWLLLFLSADALGVDGPSELDPVRIQKGMFILSERGPARGVYTFRPYNWGPFSPQIYGDLDLLVATGLAEVERAPGRTWKRYTTTPKGERRAAALVADASGSDIKWLGKARNYVTSRSFAQLLREIYAEFPEYATESLLR
jgi:DNA-binding PadR family transcriptional regulator